MGRELNHAELQELLGAYALDAVDDAERHAVEDHLDMCRQCRAEVSEHREVAAHLGAGWMPAPEGVWDRIAGALEETPPAMRPVVSMDEARERRRRRSLTGPMRAVAALGAAAAVAMVAVLGYTIVDTKERVGDVAQSLEGNVARTAEAAARRPDARTVELKSTSGALTAEAVLLGDGTGYLVDANLPQLPPDRTYQLWAVVGQNKISVGVLGPRAGPVAFHTSGDVGALAITEEVAGGVVVSQATPTVVGVIA
jgi:anti-sigma factor RsiW